MPLLAPGDVAGETSVLYEGYARLRAHRPIFRREDGVWIVTRYADAALLMTDRRLAHWQMPVPGPPFAAPMNRWLHALEPGEAATLRTRIRDCADPRRLHDAVAREARRAEAMLESREEVDLIADFARPFTLRIAASLLGIAADAHDSFVDAVTAIKPHLFSAIGRRDALHDLLLAQRGSGSAWSEAGRDLTDEDFVAFTLFLLFASHDNMTNFIGNAWLALHTQDGAVATLRHRPELWSSAIDELLRWDSPVQYLSATAREPVDAGDTTIERGETVWISIGSANRDGERFQDPDRLLLDREGNLHLSFGLGSMRCVGAALAKVEAVTALRLLLRLEGVRLLQAPEWRRDTAVLRGPASIHVRYESLSPDRS